MEIDAGALPAKLFLQLLDRYGDRIAFIRHPDAFHEAKRYEKTAVNHGSPFTWSQGESLEELSKPERITAIKGEHKRRLERLKNKTQRHPLRSDYEPLDIDDIYGRSKVYILG
jgi:hypothetical protein